MKPRTYILTFLGVALIIGFGFIIDTVIIPKPTSSLGAELLPSKTVPPKVLVPTPPPSETNEWQTYYDQNQTFMLSVPPDWLITTVAEEQNVLFAPPAPAPYEVERNPHIILEITSFVNVSGVHPSFDTWFDTEVIQNPERFDVVQTKLNGNSLYSFTEGVAEYPHKNFLITRGEDIYWFTINASDEKAHNALPLIVQSIRFLP
jgi:hypothetical protein